jgi:hypothetical protein
MAIIKKDKKRYPAPERQRRDNLELKAQLLALEEGESLTITLDGPKDLQGIRQLVFRLGNTLGKSFSTSHLAEEKKLRIWAQ